jgi:hypothetical protein
MPSVGQELLAVPFPEMVLKLASAIAEGQYKLDVVSCQIAQLMGTTIVEIPKIDATDDKAEGDTPVFTTEKVSMLGAGFQPTFYQFTDTIIEIKMAISMNRSTDASVSVSAKAGFGPFAASVNASYSSKYSYSVEGSSLLRTKITPVPPNAFLTKLLELKIAMMQEAMMRKLKVAEDKLAATTKTVPDVMNKTIEEGTKVLEDNKFKVTASKKDGSPTIENQSSQITNVSPAAGTEVSKDDDKEVTVDFVGVAIVEGTQ